MGTKNLFTTENAAEKGRKGGKKSGETRRQKRDMKNFARTFLEMGMKEGPLDDFSSLEDAKGKNLAVGENVIIALGLKAIKGDKYAAELLFKFADLIPNQKVDVNADVKADVNETNNELNNILGQLTEYKETSKYFKKEDE